MSQNGLGLVESSYSVATETVMKPRQKRRRRDPDMAPIDVILPPCKICEEKSSGFHYGVNTCEACKGFYRRTLKKKEVNYKCKCTPEEREYWKRGPYKNGCPSCRYQRCLTLGMSKNAMKIGRYTMKHRTQNIREVKDMEAGLSGMRNIDDLIDKALTMGNFDDSEDSGIWSPGDITDESNDHVTSSFVGPPTKKQSIQDVSRYIYSDISLMEIDSIVKTLTEAQLANSLPPVDRVVENRDEKQSKYLEQYNLRTQVFGEMKPLSSRDFRDIYTSTGIDIDGRMEHILDAITFFESRVTEFVKFSKSIPGFKKLCIDDQASLIKASRVENAMFGCYKHINKSLDQSEKIVTTPWDKEVHIDEFSKILPTHMYLDRYKFAKRMVALQFTPEEEAVIRALIVVISDRCELRETEKVAILQDKLTACLQHLVLGRSGGAGTKLYKIMSLVTDLRDLAESETNVSKELLIKLPELVSESDYKKKYALLQEFYG